MTQNQRILCRMILGFLMVTSFCGVALASEQDTYEDATKVRLELVSLELAMSR